MNIRKGDIVIIRSGRDRGRKGKVLSVFPREGKISVEGLNIRKRHMRPKRSGEKGQIIEISAPLGIANALIVCGKCGKATRVGHRVEGKEKLRICKKCGYAL